MKKRSIAFLCSLSVLLTSSMLYAAGDPALSIEGGAAGPVQISTVSDVGDASADIPDFSYANIADLAEAVMPSIVAITNTSVQEVRSFFYGRHSYQYESKSAGSGIIVGSNDTELLICTNNHVVEGARDLTVSFINNESFSAQIKGTDARNDLAVVAVQLTDIPQETMDAIRIARIGDSDTMRIGEQVVAIGNALGYGQSVTTGIISAKDRSINTNSSNSGSYYTYGQEEDSDVSVFNNLIQTDAAINPGNSGGALLNMNGEVIGINSAKAAESDVEGMGYAIPISAAMPILENLMTQVTRTRVEDSEVGYVGFNGQDVSYDAIMFYDIPSGVYITYVAEDGPSAQAGLTAGDILLSFDGHDISGLSDLTALLPYYRAGETVSIEVYTQNTASGYYEEVTMDLTLGQRPVS
ncbi:MAG: trypsin-like peptidase domain-containing protein [Lachnospiraceae bacterium]|nr:trypsin-like peptidase domain-containing protein [Lachnospiraceae bacterium]